MQEKRAKRAWEAHKPAGDLQIRISHIYNPKMYLWQGHGEIFSEGDGSGRDTAMTTATYRGGRDPISGVFSSSTHS